jgi:hypothetical protein
LEFQKPRQFFDRCSLLGEKIMNAQMETKTLDPQILAHLEEHGHAIIPGAFSPKEVEACRTALNVARENGWEEGLDSVGNM